MALSERLSISLAASSKSFGIEAAPLSAIYIMGLTCRFALIGGKVFLKKVKNAHGTDLGEES
jgi:hypothetical protein